MKKGIRDWQLLVGTILCGLAIIFAFTPKYAVNAARITKTCVNIVKSSAGGVLSSFYDEDSIADLEESIEEEIIHLEEEGVKLSYSNFDIATHSLESYFRDWYSDSYKKKNVSIKEMMEEFYSNASKEEIMGMENIKLAYNVLRTISIVSILLPIVLLVFFFLCWFKKVPRWLLVIFSGLWFVIQMGYIIALTVVLPRKIAGEIPSVYGVDLSSLLVKLLRSLFWCLHGMGYYIEVVLTVLLLALSILCLIIKVKKRENSLVQPDNLFQSNIINQPESFDSRNSGAVLNAFTPSGGIGGQSEMMGIDGVGQTAAFIQPNNNVFQSNPFEENNYTVPLSNGVSAAEIKTETSAKQSGKICVLEGSMKGAEIDMKVGEKIIIGRDPLSCQLILMDIKVSRKHCMIAFNSATGMYHVDCYSQNGLILSDKYNLMVNQCAEVPRGTKIILADGKEVILLA